MLLWHGRYALTEDRPEHRSATSFVYKAVDEGVKDEFGHPRRVALKLMRCKGQFMREVQSRKKLFSGAFYVLLAWGERPVCECSGDDAHAVCQWRVCTVLLSPLIFFPSAACGCSCYGHHQRTTW